MKEVTLDKKTVITCYLASCLEIYDFVIFSFFAPLIHKNYLSFLDEGTSLIITYALFAVGFIFRPIGSLIFGYIGDVYGRKKALILSVSMMGGSSFVMFALPTYEQIGVWSCFIIAIVRMIQGISVGGEFSGALIYAIEHNSKSNAGLIGGILSAGGSSGVLLATIVSTALQNPWLPEYSWRFAFLVGVGLSIIGYIIRKNLSETPIFMQLKNNNKKIPLFEGMINNKIECIATICMAAANGATFYFAVIYFPNYLKSITDLEIGSVSLLITLILLFGSPLFGWISDRISRLKLLVCSTLIMGLYIMIMLSYIQVIIKFEAVRFALIVYGIILSMLTSTINTHCVEIFPASYRMSCMGLFYSIGMGIIGGTVPVVSSIVVNKFGNNPMYLGLYLSIICFSAGISAFLVYRKTIRTPDISKNPIIGNKNTWFLHG